MRDEQGVVRRLVSDASGVGIPAFRGVNDTWEQTPPVTVWQTVCNVGGGTWVAVAEAGVLDAQRDPAGVARWTRAGWSQRVDRHRRRRGHQDVREGW